MAKWKFIAKVIVETDSIDNAHKEMKKLEHKHFIDWQLVKPKKGKK